MRYEIATSITPRAQYGLRRLPTIRVSVSRYYTSSIMPPAGRAKLELWPDADQHDTAAGELVDSLPVVYLCAKKRGVARPLSLSPFRGVAALGGRCGRLLAGLANTGSRWTTTDLAGGWPSARRAREAFSPKTRCLPLLNQIHCYGPLDNTMLAMWRGTQLEVAP